jgi:ribose transport system substrate-binding protein
MAKLLRFIIVPKVAHPWHDEVNKGAQVQANLLHK